MSNKNSRHQETRSAGRPDHLVARRKVVWAAACCAAWYATSPEHGTAEEPTAFSHAVSNLSLVKVPAHKVRLIASTGKPVVVTAIATDPSGRFVAVAGDDHVIRIVDGETLRTIHELTGHRDRIRTLDLHPVHGSLVSAGNDGQLIVWDTRNNFKIQEQLRVHTAIASVCCSPSGKHIAAVGFDREIQLFELHQDANAKPSLRASKKERLKCACRDLRAVAFRDDEELLLVAGRTGGVYLFDPQSGDLISEHQTHRARIADLVFARDRELAILVGEDGSLVTFDTQTKQVVRRIPVTSGKLFAAATISRDLVAVAGSDNVIRIIDIDRGNVVRVLPGHRGSVPALALCGDHLFSGGFDAMLSRWSVANLAKAEQRIAETGADKPGAPEQR